jgi:hypothetical protein
LTVLWQARPDTCLPAAGLSGGELNWIKVDEEIFDHAGKRISVRFYFIRLRRAKEQSRKGFPWRLVFNFCAFA